MKEGAPQEIGGIDVTNVPAESQEAFLAQAHNAQVAEANLPAAQAALQEAKQVRNEHAARLADSGMESEREITGEAGYQWYTGEIRDARSNLLGAQKKVNDANEIARDFVEEGPDIEVARAEMERALKKDIEEKLG